MLSPGSTRFEALLGWLASRQTGNLGEDEDDDDEEEEDEDDLPEKQSASQTEKGYLEDRIAALPNIIPLTVDAIPYAGFNGRLNKVADTCYSFWNGGTLMVCALPRAVD